ncbi:MAG: phosphonate ABC transporter, permease protein PhnE [Rubrimonas sp.]|uniref:phosphonate ABC transporter, permease protein PhnE n=1 Tax=Rubrimonas sp. TaxID=2036015 RepID=UPI002FDDD15A
MSDRPLPADVAARIARARIAHARVRAPEAFRPRPGARLRAWGGLALVASVTAFAIWRLDLGFAQLWDGLGRLGFLIALMVPPSPGGYPGDIARAMLETVAMAFLGTLLSSTLSLPLGFLGARNVVTNALAHFSLRRLFDSGRAIDSLVWALFFISVVGLGPFAGMLALAAGDIGSLSKLYAEAIENAEVEQVEGVRATGAGPVQTAWLGYLPQVLPVILSHALFYFEGNVRSASILGVVGAGGIGMLLSERIRAGDWPEAAFIILVILIAVALLDALSKEIRLRIVADPARGRP